MNGKERKKTFFAKSEESRASHQMTASELRDLIYIYNKKYNIQIVMNGVSDDGKNAIEKENNLKWHGILVRLCSLHHIMKI